LKEQKLAKALVFALDLPRNSSAAIKLEHWKTPTKDDVSLAISLASVRQRLIGSLPSPQPGAGEFA
jgi:hypothetical protein